MNLTDLIKECKFSFSRSGGAGGQHVNKVNTRVELRFNVNNSLILSAENKQRLFLNLRNQITNQDELVLTADRTRSQAKNKEEVSVRFIELIRFALRREKPRIKTKPKKSSIEKRLKAKKHLAEKKAYRKKNY